MKKIFLFLLTFLNIFLINAQLDENSVMGLPKADTVSQMNAISPIEGAVVYNIEDETIYYYNGSSTWVPITSKAPRVFYPPSVEIVIAATATNATMSLYDMYIDQFGASIPATHRSTSAPDAIPTYEADELYYYVTKADTDIFNIVSITDTGLLTYDILDIPDDDNTILNIVFVVK